MTATTAYDRILDALEHEGMQVRRSGQRARAQCPVHGSRGLTLSISNNTDRAFVHCFAGCADVDVLAALGLTVRDLFDQERDPDEYVPLKPKPVPTAWDQAMAAIGLRPPYPGLDHVLDRILAEEEKRAQHIGPLCPTCGTPCSPWTCSCGQTRVGPDYWGLS